jgi:arsenite-transporting ATPase
MSRAPTSPNADREQALASLFSRRVILVAGKGGVGRTTLSSAMALAAVQQGKKVLLAEFEEPAGFRASPLADHFGRSVFPSSPVPIAEGLHGVTITAELGIELFLTGLFKVPALSRLALRTPALRNMLRAGPSFHEMGLFYHMLMQIREKEPSGADRFDLMIIDMPATGHALALTGLSSILLELVRRGPIADALRDGRSVFYDPAQCAACVVTLPEPLPVSECLELIQGLRNSEMTVGAVVANRVPTDPFSAAEREALDGLLEGRVVRGLTLVERIRRADGSMARLRDAVRVPMIVVPDFDLEPCFRAAAEHLAGDAP